MPGTTTFSVDAASAGVRLDAFVAGALAISAAGARRLIAAGAVRVDGKRAAKGARVAVGARIEIAAAAATTKDGGRSPPLPDPELGRALRVIHEDADLVAVDKPSGMPSHPLRPGERGTVANALVARYPECAGAAPDAREGGLGHRLDTATSGVLVAARSRAAWEGLRRALGAADCEKRYLAEVEGAPPAAGEITAPIGRRGRHGGTVRVDGGRNPLPAETRWTVLAQGSATALVEARLRSGRPHQVRAHLAAAGHPIVGDDRYGGGGAVAAACPQLRLHAAGVRLTHPVTGAALVIEAPRPAWAAAFEGR